MNLDAWKSQLRKGAAELAVLALLEARESYGLSILRALVERGGLEISEGTIYPLLNRLRRDGKIASRWVEEEGASHPRKYYFLTDDGRRLLGEMKVAWRELASNLDALVTGECHDD